jgi:hypothetical protein
MALVDAEVQATAGRSINGRRSVLDVVDMACPPAAVIT